MELDESLSYS